MSKGSNDLKGMLFGKLRVWNRDGEDRWMCGCKCHEVVIVPEEDLIHQRVTSCGCDGGKKASVHTKKVASAVIDGEILSIKKLSIKHGLNYSTLLARHKKGIKGMDLINGLKPSNGKRGRSETVMVEIDGEIMTARKFAKIHGVAYSTVYGRYKRGIKGMDLLSGLKRKEATS